MIKSLPALRNQSVSAIVITLCLASPVWASDKLSPRAEVNFRAGTERSILMTEFWAPLAQQSDRVLYGDLRLMGDDGDNREGNLGFGYRQISKKTNSVLGVNAWIDRRRTENGNNFHQITLGVESLGETIDIRANGYIQLNGSKTRVTPNIGSATPYLAGSGIFFDTNGSIVEEPQHGFDAEVGYRLPVLQKYIDSTRVYAGGYHFFGDTTESTTGFRLRTEAQVNSIFSVGARFQHDEPRGSQGFLEATLRFPFKSKKLFQEHGLKSRLDESPERDIDIVTGAKVDTGLGKQALNLSGTEQRILYVDNTNANAGDGSKENPFNTLKAAESVLKDNDILYINRGDGTSKGMNRGLIIDKANIQLIGSGSDLAYEGHTLIVAGQAPIITNTDPSSVSYDANSFETSTGNSIFINSTNAFVSGLTIQNDSRIGIYVLAQAETNLGSITIKNNTIFGDTSYAGIFVWSFTGSSIDDVLIENNLSQGSSTGIVVQSSHNNSTIKNVQILNNVTNNNTQNGAAIYSGNIGSIDNIIIDNLIANNNTNQGLVILSSSNGTIGTINNLNLRNVNANNNGQQGVNIQAATLGSMIDSVSLHNIVTNNNGRQGIRIAASNGGVVSSASIFNSMANGNLGPIGQGIHIESNGTGSSITNVVLFKNTTNNNTQNGLFIQAATNAAINSVTISGLQASYNTQNGFNAVSSGNTIINKIDAANIVANNNTQNGVLLSVGIATSVINNASLSQSTMVGNGINGIQLVKSHASATFNIDLGGGSQNGVGQNRIFNNVGSDLRLNYTGGGNVFARNNWWGVSTGLAPGRVTLSASTTVDATAFLTTDPRP